MAHLVAKDPQFCPEGVHTAPVDTQEGLADFFPLIQPVKMLKGIGMEARSSKGVAKKSDVPPGQAAQH